MNKRTEPVQSNFAQLAEHDEQLVRLGLLAERYFPDDPNTSILKLRQLAELLAQKTAASIGLYVSSEESQFELIRRLQDKGVFSREICQLFGEVRRAGNVANHEMTGDHRTALATLKISWQLGIWFHRTFKDAGFKAGAFIPPGKSGIGFQPVKSGTTGKMPIPPEVQAELDRLNQERDAFQSKHKEAVQQLSSTEAKLEQASSEQAFWEAMALEAENDKAELKERLEAIQAQAAEQPKEDKAKIVAAANKAAQSVHLDEAETRKLIDEQLRQAGWEVDSNLLRYAKGTRPEKGKNKAIAEWPTENMAYSSNVGVTNGSPNQRPTRRRISHRSRSWLSVTCTKKSAK